MLGTGFCAAGTNELTMTPSRKIELVVKEAGLEKIDYFITSHFHGDHVGGLAALAERIEIGQFLDHGDSVEKDSERGRDLWKAYHAR